MNSYGFLQMAVQKQGGQPEPTYSSSVRIWGVALGTYRMRWTIGRGGERGSGISVLMAQQDDERDQKHFIKVFSEISENKVIFTPFCNLRIITGFCLFYFGFVWFGFFVKWHINLHGLFNAKAILVEAQ